MIKYKHNNGYKRKECGISDEQIIKDYETMTQREIGEKYGLKMNQIAVIMQRNGVRKASRVSEEQEPPRPKPIPPVGAKVRIGRQIKTVIQSYKYFFLVSGVRVETVHRTDKFEVVG